LGADPETRRNLLWSMRKNPSGWNAARTTAMHWLQRYALKGARAWRLFTQFALANLVLAKRALLDEARQGIGAS